MQITNSSKTLLLAIVIFGWFALISQFYLIIENKVTSVPETIIRYFSYFTILTNLIVAICCTTLLNKFDSKLKNFFSKQDNLTAIAVYITIVGIVYNIILRFLWKPEGLQGVVDELLHSIIPALFIVLWIFFTPKGKISLKNVLAWLLYPLIYLILILVRGSFSAFYPYPFIEVSKIEYNKTLINSAGMLLAFLVVSTLFIALNRFKKPVV